MYNYETGGWGNNEKDKVRFAKRFAGVPGGVYLLMHADIIK